VPITSRKPGAGFVAYVLELLEPVGGCSARAMFGGHGIYRDDRIFGLVIGDTLYLKADTQSESDFAAIGSAPFVYQGKGRAVQMSYWSLPVEALDSPEEMIRWARLAQAAAARKAASKAGRVPSSRRNVPPDPSHPDTVAPRKHARR
jgi:DNA transformation protein